MRFHAVDWYVFLAVPAIAWLIAIAGRLRTGTAGAWRGYFLARGQLSTTTTAAAYIGANLTFTSIFLILSAESFHRGWWTLAIPVAWMLGTLLFVACYPLLKPHIAAERTLHQTLGHVFQSQTLQRWASIWTIVAFVGTVALEFYGGILLIRWTGLPMMQSIGAAMILAYVVSVFTSTGGMRGIGWADIWLDLFSLQLRGVSIRWHWPWPLKKGLGIKIRKFGRRLFVSLETSLPI